MARISVSQGALMNRSTPALATQHPQVAGSLLRILRAVQLVSEMLTVSYFYVEEVKKRTHSSSRASGFILDDRKDLFKLLELVMFSEYHRLAHFRHRLQRQWVSDASQGGHGGMWHEAVQFSAIRNSCSGNGGSGAVAVVAAGGGGV